MQRNASGLAGYIDPAMLSSGNVAQAVRAAVERKKAFDEFWGENLMGSLAKGGKSQEAAIERVADMQSLSEIRMAKAFFSQPAQFQRVQQLSLQKLLSNAVATGSDPFSMPLGGSGLTKTLVATGRDKLEEMFGPELTNDLFDLGNTLRYVTGAKEGRDAMAGALRAGTLMFHPLTHMPAIIQSALESALMMKPGFIRWVTMGLEGDSRMTAKVANTVRLAAYSMGEEIAGVATAPPNEYSEPGAPP